MTTAIEDLLAKVKPATASVRMCLRGDLLGDLDLIDDDLDELNGWEPSSMSDVDPRTELRSRKADKEAQMRLESATFSFVSIGDKPWSDLLAKHSPREGKEESFNPETFPVALLAAAATDPTMTVAQAAQLMAGFTLNQRNTIFGAAYSANIRGVDVPFLQPSFDAAKTIAKKPK